MLKVITTIAAIQVLVILTNILRSKASALLLGPAGVGVVSIVDQAVQVVLQLSTLSLPFVAVKFLSRSHSRGFAAFQHSYASFLRALVGLTLVGSTLAVALAWWRPELLGFVAQYRLLFTVAMFALPAIALQGLVRNVFAAMGRARTAALLDVSVALVIALAVVPGMLVAGALGYYVAQTCAALVIAAAALAYIRQHLGLGIIGTGSTLRRELRDNQGIATFALINYVVSFTTPLAFLVARYAVLDRLGEASAGLLQSAYAVSLVVQLVLNPANGLFLTPLLNRDIPAPAKLAAAMEFQRKLMVVTGILAMPIVLFPEWLLYLFYSRDFLAVAGAVVLFVAAQALLQQAGVYQALMIGLDNLKAYGAIMLLAQLIMAGAAWLLVPERGIEGVALGLLLSSGWLLLALSIYLHLRQGLVIPLRSHGLTVFLLASLLLAGHLVTGHGGLDPLVIAGKLAFYAGFVLSLGLLFLDRADVVELMWPAALLARAFGAARAARAPADDDGGARR